MNSRIIFTLLALTVSCSTINGGAANTHEDLALNALLDDYPTGQYGNGVRLMHRLHNLIRKLSYKANGIQRLPLTESEKEISTSNINESQDRGSDDSHIKEVTDAASSRHSKREYDHTLAKSESVAKKHDEPGMFPFKKSDDGKSDTQPWNPIKKADMERRWYQFKKEDQDTPYWYPFKRENSNNRREPGFYPFKRRDIEQWLPFKRANHQDKHHSEREDDQWGYPFKRRGSEQHHAKRHSEREGDPWGYPFKKAATNAN